MQAVAGHLTLSPSDLNDYVECAHLTTLALEVARGERARPHVADEHAELLRRKGEEHERAHLERLRAEGRAIEWPREARSNRQGVRSVCADARSRQAARFSIGLTAIRSPVALSTAFRLRSSGLPDLESIL